MFNKILIANRGEIACRIIRTARRLGIATVAVYSEADTNSLHVTMADEAVFIGSSPASQSYLDIDKIIDACRTSGVEAVHPAYGFLSENACFAKALQDNKITFIGPSVYAIEKMGDKIEAKKIAKEAKVNTIPGYSGEIKDEKEAVKIASKVGFPVMIKAAAGGGGKGMRVVRSAKEVPQAFTSATNEAQNSFSDGRIFIEKFIEKPRHIEIQVLADTHGNIVCLGERECSIQRHHQKVIEEAPSPFLDDKTRQAMYKQCVSLAKKVKYVSAGTVEFIMDSEKNFYFLEMNTRLQVEHPVTELVTGIDIVEQMVRIAAGEKLSITQKDVQLKGWAMESRVYAEDPSRGFLPSSGRISHYKEPKISEGVRIDSGVYEGGMVSMFYDPMIAKLCTYGKDRAQAIERMQAALGEFVIHGISHNISFLEALVAHKRFAAGDMTTNFIDEEYPDGFFGAQLTSATTRVFLSVAAHVFMEDARRATSISGQIPGRERQIGNRWVINIDGDSFPVYVRARDNGYDVKYDNEYIIVRSSWLLGSPLLQGLVNDRKVSVRIDHFAGGFYLTHAGSQVKVTVRSPRIAELSKFLPENVDGNGVRLLEAPISGNVVDIKVKEGDAVKPGNDLVVLEAMKMENIICAEHECVVSKIHVKPGDNVSYGQLMIEFDPVEEE